MCIGVWSACISVKVPDALELELRTATKLPWECRELNSGPREEQAVSALKCLLSHLCSPCISNVGGNTERTLTLNRSLTVSGKHLKRKKKGTERSKENSGVKGKISIFNRKRERQK